MYPFEILYKQVKSHILEYCLDLLESWDQSLNGIQNKSFNWGIKGILWIFTCIELLFDYNKKLFYKGSI